VVFSDPPYNVKIDGHVCGAGSIKHREFAMASGEMKNLATVLHQVLAERVRVREGDAVRTVSKWEAMIQTLSNKAMKGDTKAFNAVSTLAQKAGQLETAEPARTHPVLIVPGDIERGGLGERGSQASSKVCRQRRR
jgi:hypothetical protein